MTQIYNKMIIAEICPAKYVLALQKIKFRKLVSHLNIQ